MKSNDSWTILVNLLGNEDAIAEEILELYELGQRVLFIQHLNIKHAAITFVERGEEIIQ